jgi:hypothetical protein
MSIQYLPEGFTELRKVDCAGRMDVENYCGDALIHEFVWDSDNAGYNLYASTCPNVGGSECGQNGGRPWIDYAPTTEVKRSDTAPFPANPHTLFSCGTDDPYYSPFNSKLSWLNDGIAFTLTKIILKADGPVGTGLDCYIFGSPIDAPLGTGAVPTWEWYSGATQTRMSDAKIKIGVAGGAETAYNVFSGYAEDATWFDNGSEEWGLMTLQTPVNFEAYYGSSGVSVPTGKGITLRLFESVWDGQYSWSECRPDLQYAPITVQIWGRPTLNDNQNCPSSLCSAAKHEISTDASIFTRIPVTIPAEISTDASIQSRIANWEDAIVRTNASIYAWVPVVSVFEMVGDGTLAEIVSTSDNVFVMNGDGTLAEIIATSDSVFEFFGNGTLAEIFATSGDTGMLAEITATGQLVQRHSIVGFGTLAEITAAGEMSLRFNMDGDGTLAEISGQGQVALILNVDGDGTLAEIFSGVVSSDEIDTVGHSVFVINAESLAITEYSVPWHAAVTHGDTLYGLSADGLETLSGPLEEGAIASIKTGRLTLADTATVVGSANLLLAATQPVQLVVTGALRDANRQVVDVVSVYDVGVEDPLLESYRTVGLAEALLGESWTVEIKAPGSWSVSEASLGGVKQSRPVR